MEAGQIVGRRHGRMEGDARRECRLYFCHTNYKDKVENQHRRAPETPLAGGDRASCPSPRTPPSHLASFGPQVAALGALLNQCPGMKKNQNLVTLT